MDRAKYEAIHYEFLLASCYLLLLSKYSSPHLVLKHAQSDVLVLLKDQDTTTQKKNRRNYSFVHFNILHSNPL